jgi:hypothetical protein
MPIGSFHVMAPVPFVVPNFRNNGRTYPDVVEYLKSRQQDDSKIQFRPAYTAAPAMRMTIAILASVLVIGGIWPTFVGLITGQGLLLMPRRGAGGKTASASDWPDEPSKTHGIDYAARAAAMGQVGEMNAQLEAGLGKRTAGGAPGNAPGGAAQGAPGQPGIKKLSASGEPMQAPITTQPEEPKEYKGQFYPVAQPHHHPEDPKKK